jgi:hypothetical protein
LRGLSAGLSALLASIVKTVIADKVIDELLGFSIPWCDATSECSLIHGWHRLCFGWMSPLCSVARATTSRLSKGTPGFKSVSEA